MSPGHYEYKVMHNESVYIPYKSSSSGSIVQLRINAILRVSSEGPGVYRKG